MIILAVFVAGLGWFRWRSWFCENSSRNDDGDDDQDDWYQNGGNFEAGMLIIAVLGIRRYRLLVERRWCLNDLIIIHVTPY